MYIALNGTKINNIFLFSRYTSYVKPEIPLGNIQNGGPQGKVGK